MCLIIPKAKAQSDVPDQGSTVLRNCPMVVNSASVDLATLPRFTLQAGNCRQNYDPTDTAIYRIPVVVHIIHNGEAIGIGANVDDARVYEQIQTLNEDFRRRSGTRGFNTDQVGADTRIEFVLASTDTAGRPFSGIVRRNGGQSSYSLGSTSYKRLSFYRSDQYFNIWVINLNTYLGFGSWPISTLPGMNGLGNYADSARDGLVVSYKYFGNTGTLGGNYNLGRTATHEIGHCLGLLHVWADGNCQATDYCNDTPSQDGQIFFCPTTVPNSCPADRLGPDQIANYLQYTDDRCMNLFTRDQVTRMRTVIQTSPLRCTLLASPALSLPANEPLFGTKVYPNPIRDGYVSVMLPKATIVTKISWINSIGKTLNMSILPDVDLSNPTTGFKLNAPTTPGIYFLQLSGVIGKPTTLKLVVN